MFNFFKKENDGVTRVRGITSEESDTEQSEITKVKKYHILEYNVTIDEDDEFVSILTVRDENGNMAYISMYAESDDTIEEDVTSIKGSYATVTYYEDETLLVKITKE